MKYVVDPALCTGHGQCFARASAVYSLDDEGFNATMGVPVDVPPNLEDEAREGVQACPEGAIMLHQ
nr:ferredoxin [Rhodococcus wratislaviensis]GLK41153.1 hypothetical protein GCM10017611_80280 [Rhodococcus wratislaviensis]